MSFSYSAKELLKIIKSCRKLGVESLKTPEFELNFKKGLTEEDSEETYSFEEEKERMSESMEKSLMEEDDREYLEMINDPTKWVKGHMEALKNDESART